MTQRDADGSWWPLIPHVAIGLAADLARQLQKLEADLAAAREAQRAAEAERDALRAADVKILKLLNGCLVQCQGVTSGNVVHRAIWIQSTLEVLKKAVERRMAATTPPAEPAPGDGGAGWYFDDEGTKRCAECGDEGHAGKDCPSVPGECADECGDGGER